MNLEIRSLHVPVSPSLQQFSRERVLRALRPFMTSIERIDLRFEDLNGPRGGIDKQCTVTVTLNGFRRAVVVKSASADIYDAAHRAAARLGQAVQRALTRRRTLARYGAPRQLEPTGDGAEATDASA